MSTAWKVVIVIMAIAMLVGGYLLFGRLSDAEGRVATAETRLARLRDLHMWVVQDLAPKYQRTHARVWEGADEDSDPPPLPRDPPGFD